MPASAGSRERGLVASEPGLVLGKFLTFANYAEHRVAREKLHYFKWFPKDFEVDENVKLMNLEEVGLYALCLNHAWINGSLPADPAEINRAMKIPRKQFVRAWTRVSRCFVSKEDGRLVNPRQEKERQQALSKSEKNTANALRSHDVRKQNASPRALTRPECVSDSDSQKGDAGETWRVAGWSGPEEFEFWWLQVVTNHPNKYRNAPAKAVIFERIVSGQFTREKFETGYAKLFESKRREWLERDGKFCPNLYEIIENRLYEFAPEPAKSIGDQYETPEEREARIAREEWAKNA